MAAIFMAVIDNKPVDWETFLKSFLCTFNRKQNLSYFIDFRLI